MFTLLTEAVRNAHENRGEGEKTAAGSNAKREADKRGVAGRNVPRYEG